VRTSTPISADMGRREVLRLVAALTGGGAGVFDGKPSKDPVLLPPGIDTRAIADGRLILAEDYPTASESALDRTPAIALTETGNTWLFGSEAVRFTMPEADIDIILNAESYSDAKDKLRRYPTIAFTANGNQFVFTEGS
jgi:hypothetical protein